MRIIALIGKSYTGKTTTLKEVILKLAGNDGENLLHVPVPRRYKTFIGPHNKEKLLDMKESNGDVFVNLKYRSFKIGISTSGDADYLIKDKFDILKEHCDYFICASRDSGKSFSYIRELEKDYKVTKLYKVGCIGDETREIYKMAKEHINDMSVIQIFAVLENLCKEK